MKKYPVEKGRSYFVSLLHMGSIVAEFESLEFDFVVLSTAAKDHVGPEHLIQVSFWNDQIGLRALSVAHEIRNAAREFFLDSFRPRLTEWLNECVRDRDDRKRTDRNRTLVMVRVDDGFSMWDDRA